jgi:hypothetical protein
MSGVYTFAVVPATATVSDLPPIPDVHLRLIDADGVAAVAEQVDVTDFESPRLERNLADPAWLEHMVRQHEQVVEALLDRMPVLPMRFGSIFSDETALRAMLTRHVERLSELLRAVDGRVEWGVRLYLDRDAMVRELAPTAETATTGADYLRRRRDALQAQDHVQDLAGELADLVHRELSALAVDAVVLDPSRSEPTALLNAAYLVDRAVAAEFLARASDLDRAHAGCSLNVTGPWPAYSFTRIDVAGPEN